MIIDSILHVIALDAFFLMSSSDIINPPPPYHHHNYDRPISTTVWNPYYFRSSRDDPSAGDLSLREGQLEG